MGRKMWTEEDRALIRKMALQCIPVEDIAEQFGTTKAAIRNQIQRIGLHAHYRTHCGCDHDEETNKEERIYNRFEFRPFSTYTAAKECYRLCANWILAYETANDSSGGYRLHFTLYTDSYKDKRDEIVNEQYGRYVVEAGRGIKVTYRNEELLAMIKRNERYNGTVIVPSMEYLKTTHTITE